MDARHIDPNQFSPHVAQAIKEMNLPLHAYLRAEKGQKWLDQHAPPDWRLQMMSIHAGQVRSRVHMVRDNENPLALAFRRSSELQAPASRPTYAMVMKYLRLSHDEAQNLGFVEMELRVGDIIITKYIDAQYLDRGWEIVLYTLDWQDEPAAYPKAA
jgi:hypothetical protein